MSNIEVRKKRRVVFYAFMLLVMFTAGRMSVQMKIEVPCHGDSTSMKTIHMDSNAKMLRYSANTPLQKEQAELIKVNSINVLIMNLLHIHCAADAAF